MESNSEEIVIQIADLVVTELGQLVIIVDHDRTDGHLTGMTLRPFGQAWSESPNGWLRRVCSVSEGLLALDRHFDLRTVDAKPVSLQTPQERLEAVEATNQALLARIAALESRRTDDGPHQSDK